MNEVTKSLREMEDMMPLALVTDVVKFEHLTSLYASTYCIKLRMMK